MNISQVAKLSGLTPKTIRYYESIGIIEAAARNHNGYRLYDDNTLGQLQFVRRARDAGFSLEQCQQLLSLYRNPQRTSAEVKALAEQKIEELEKKISEMQQMLGSLRQLSATCKGDEHSECPIINHFAAPHHQSKP